MLRKIFTGFYIVIYSSGFSQTEDTLRLSLDDCIKIALEKNLDLRRAELQAETSEVNVRQSWNDILPSLNASASAGINNGRSIDPFTNAYIEEQLSYSNARLFLDVTVFNGFRIKNSIQRDRFNLQASEMETEEAKQNLILDVTLAYMQILNNRDLVTLANLRLETTSGQMERLAKLFDEGAGNPADYSDIQGQLASDRRSLVNAQNSLTKSLLNLSLLLNADATITPEATPLELSPQEYSFSAEEVFEDALNNLPGFKARELRINAAEKNVSVSKSLYSPQISLFGQLNTNFSSVARLYTEDGSILTETGGFVTVGDENLPVLINEPQYLPTKIPFYNQLNNNLNSVVGVALDIPLFNGFRAKNAIALQKIQLEESQVDLESTRLSFRQAIKQAYADMQAAYDQYLILQEQVEAYRESFRVNEIRYNSGVSNIVQYIISKNNLESSEVNLTIAKYEYLLRVKVLEYYRGNM